MTTTTLTRYESLYLQRDGETIASLLKNHGRNGFRVWQGGKLVAEVGRGSWNGGGIEALAALMRQRGADPDGIVDVEVFGTGRGAKRRGTPKVFIGSSPGCAMNPAGLHKGGTLFLCLNGPSFDEETRAMLQHRPGVTTFCINNGGHGFRPHYWACGDSSDRFMESIWTDGTIAKFVPAGFFKKNIFKDGDGPTVGECEAVWAYRRNTHFRPERFLTDSSLNWGNSKERGGGRSTVMVALGIAYRMGFRRVVLVGCDWEMTEEKWYWFPQTRTEKAIKNNMRTFRKMEGYFRELRPFFAEAGFEIVNATPGSRLREFPMVDLATEVARALAKNTDGSTGGMYDVG